MIDEQEVLGGSETPLASLRLPRSSRAGHWPEPGSTNVMAVSVNSGGVFLRVLLTL